MKKLLFVAATIALLLPLAAEAQIRVIGRAEIPFSFNVLKQSFPAGSYVIRLLDIHVVEIQETKTGMHTMLPTFPEDAVTGNGKLLFRNWGGRWYLRSVLGGYGKFAGTIPTSPAEREAMKLAKAATIKEVVLR